MRLFRKPLIDNMIHEIGLQRRAVDKEGKRVIPDDQIIISLCNQFEPSEIELARAWKPLHLDLDKKGFPCHDSRKCIRFDCNRINKDQRYDLEIVAVDKLHQRVDDDTRGLVSVLTTGTKIKEEVFHDACQKSAERTKSRLKGEEEKYKRLMDRVRNPAKFKQVAIALEHDIQRRKKRSSRN